MQQFSAKVIPPLNKLKTVITKRFSHIERKVKVNGIGINIVESGKGDKSVLLMPGIFGSVWTDFTPQIEQLPKLLPNHTVIAWDPPGNGKSIPPTRNWHIDAMHDDAQWAVDLMKTLRRPTFSIVGWSGGGVSALIAAIRYGENIEKLVIWGAGAYVTPKEMKMFQYMRDVSKWPARTREPMEQMYGAERFQELWNEYVAGLVSLQTERNGDVCKNELEKIKVPTFILHGKKDPIKDPEHAPYLRERIKGARYHEFPDGRHHIHLSYAEEFNNLVANFILEKCYVFLINNNQKCNLTT